jgi:hypothetical protein
MWYANRSGTTLRRKAFYRETEPKGSGGGGFGWRGLKSRMVEVWWRGPCGGLGVVVDGEA